MYKQTNQIRREQGEGVIDVGHNGVGPCGSLLHNGLFRAAGRKNLADAIDRGYLVGHVRRHDLRNIALADLCRAPVRSAIVCG